MRLEPSEGSLSREATTAYSRGCKPNGTHFNPEWGDRL